MIRLLYRLWMFFEWEKRISATIEKEKERWLSIAFVHLQSFLKKDVYVEKKYRWWRRYLTIDLTIQFDVENKTIWRMECVKVCLRMRVNVNWTETNTDDIRLTFHHWKFQLTDWHLQRRTERCFFELSSSNENRQFIVYHQMNFSDGNESEKIQSTTNFVSNDSLLNSVVGIRTWDYDKLRRDPFNIVFALVLSIRKMKYSKIVQEALLVDWREKKQGASAVTMILTICFCSE